MVAQTDPTLSLLKRLLKVRTHASHAYVSLQLTSSPSSNSSTIACMLWAKSVKISLLLLYRHLFTSKRLHLWIKITGALVVSWGITFVLVSIFSCRPIHAFWDWELQPTSYCINSPGFYGTMAVVTILTDVLILGMPVRQVWKLQLSQRSRIALTFIFSMGGL